MWGVIKALLGPSGVEDPALEIDWISPTRLLLWFPWHPRFVVEVEICRAQPAEDRDNRDRADNDLFQT